MGKGDPAADKRLLRQLLLVSENLLDMVALADSAGVLEYVSPSHKRYLGCDPESLVGRSAFELLHPDDLERIQSYLNDPQPSGEPRLEEVRYRRADGSYAWLEAIGRFILDDAGHPAGMIFSSRDITARHETEQQVRRLTRAIENSPDGVIINDLTGRIVYANGAAGALYGWRPVELQGRRITELNGTTEHVEPAYNALLEKGQWSGEVVQQRRDGSRFLASLSLSLLVQEKEVVALVKDVSQQRSLEEQLNQARKMEAVGRLAGGLTHDFNNMLSAIMCSADLMQAEMSPVDPLQADAAEIREASARAAKLTRQLLVFSRTQAAALQAIDPSQVLKRSAYLLDRVLGEDIELEHDAAPDLWPVFMDPTQLDQILVNLAANARDAMPQGGTLHVDMRNCTLTQDDLAAQADARPGEYVKLTVHDSGKGMTDEVRERIFEPFFTTKEQGEGTGLGLATVYAVVKQNQGAISVSSEQGRGTTFTLLLPRAVGQAAPLEALGTTRFPGSGETIGLVEDDEGLRRLIVRILDNLGYQVLVAESGNDALRIMAAHEGQLDLLLTDVIMPGMNGRELYEALRAQRSDLKVLYMSGYPNAIVSARGVLDQGTDLIQKPFGTASLSRKIRAVLDRKPG